ncbi:MAG TPA: hypothetical protein PLY72_02995 [Candidatus Obscuribacter sp.]|nr:hypothetical protein [Candidatus Obscuribacter sp.]
MENKPCIKSAEFDLMTRLSLSIPTGKACVRIDAGKPDGGLMVELTSAEYQVLVPESFQGYPVTVRFVGAVAPYKKSDFMCGGPEE